MGRRDDLNEQKIEIGRMVERKVKPNVRQTEDDD